MDDEKYFPLSNAETPGNAGFYTRNVVDTPDEIKYKTKAKFPEKVLVWCAISEVGVSRPYIGHVRGEAVNSNVYTQRCLPKLLEFINLHHQNDDIMFWPDSFMPLCQRDKTMVGSAQHTFCASRS